MGPRALRGCSSIANGQLPKFPSLFFPHSSITSISSTSTTTTIATYHDLPLPPTTNHYHLPPNSQATIHQQRTKGLGREESLAVLAAEAINANPVGQRALDKDLSQGCPRRHAGGGDCARMVQE